MKRRLGRTAAALAGILVLATLGGCSSRANDWTQEEYRIAGGGTTGVYYEYGTRLAHELSESLDVNVVAEETAGSVDNLRLVGSGDALLGFAQGDTAADAVKGSGPFERPLPVLAVARLYDEYVHVVVRADSKIERLSDLSGMTISLGPENSGVNVIANRVLNAAGVNIAEIDNPQLSLTAAIRAVERGEIDGFFWVGGIPTPGIDDLADTVPVRLLPVEQEWVADINRRYSYAYHTGEFPPGVYGLDSPEPTMVVPDYLVVAADAPRGVVYDVVERLFATRSSIARYVPAAELLDRRQAIFTDPVMLHPGAVDFYRDQRR